MKISAIKHQNSKLGKPFILVSTFSGNNVWLSPRQWASKGLNPALEVYVGGEIFPAYYAKGEKLLNGEECTADGVVLKDFAVTLNASIAAQTIAVSANSAMASAEEYAAAFKAARPAKIKPVSQD